MLQTQTVEPLTLELLKELMQKNYLQNFILVGGTALALHIGHRISVDLDLFSSELFDAHFIKENLGNDFASSEVDLERTNTLITKINGIKVDFIRFKYSFQYPVLLENGLRLANIKDIAPMKIDAIVGRGKKKDFFDLFFLLNYFSLPELLELYQAKYHHSTLFHIIKSINYFTDAEDSPEPFIFDKKVTWKKVKDAICKEIRKL